MDVKTCTLIKEFQLDSMGDGEIIYTMMSPDKKDIYYIKKDGVYKLSLEQIEITKIKEFEKEITYGLISEDCSICMTTDMAKIDFYNLKYRKLVGNIYFQKFESFSVNFSQSKLLVSDNKCIYLTDISDYRAEIKYLWQKEKLENPGKFIEIEDTLKMEKKDQGMFALGLLANIFVQNGTEVVIDNDNDNDNIEEMDVGITFLQLIINGFGYKTKFGFHFDFGVKRNEQLLNDQNEYKKFKERLKDKISKGYNIPKNKIILTNPEKGSFGIQAIFQSDNFNELDMKDFTEKFKNDNDFPDLQNLKYIQQDVILSGCKLSKDN
jgi:hypothetical protein